MKHVLVLMAFFGGVQAHGSLKVEAQIRVETDIPLWNQEYEVKVAQMKSTNSYPADGYTECRETLEIKGAYLCLSNTQKGMNSALARASGFIEGTFGNKGEVVEQTDATYQSYKDLIGGHDLRGADLLRFYQAATNLCSGNGGKQEFCFNSYEKDMFENFVIPYAQNSRDFVVITFANQSGMDWREVVTHEIMHAQYFNDSTYRQICDDFWETQVSEEDKETVRSRLSEYYDANDELLMKMNSKPIC